MSNVMSAEGARAMAADLQNGNADEREIAATLRAYADMLDRQAVDREAVVNRIPDVFAKYASTGIEYGELGAARDLLPDAILAAVKPRPDVSGLVEAARALTKALDDEGSKYLPTLMALENLRTELSTFKGGE